MRALLALGVYAGGVIDSLLIGGNHDVARFDYGVDLFAGGERQTFSRILRDNRNDFRSSLQLDHYRRVDCSVYHAFDRTLQHIPCTDLHDSSLVIYVGPS